MSEMRHVILISGKDSLATAIVQLSRAPNLPYELVFNEVGWELPETLEWICRVEKYFGREIIRCGDDLTEICYEQNCLPLPQRRFCTKYAKIKPLNEMLGKSPATLYMGLRADEPERVGYEPPKYQTVCYPLRETGMGLHRVWELCESINLLPPQFHWQWMESRVREKLGRDEFLLDELVPWQRAMLVAWRVRNNCSLCFYKRRYEWIGLLEFHPKLFELACKIESDLCHRQEYTWISGFKLPALRERAAKIKEQRARAIVKYLRTRQVQYLFATGDPVDELAVTSCGLLCGK